MRRTLTKLIIPLVLSLSALLPQLLLAGPDSPALPEDGGELLFLPVAEPAGMLICPRPRVEPDGRSLLTCVFVSAKVWPGEPMPGCDMLPLHFLDPPGAFLCPAPEPQPAKEHTVFLPLFAQGYEVRCASCRCTGCVP